MASGLFDTMDDIATPWSRQAASEVHSSLVQDENQRIEKQNNILKDAEKKKDLLAQPDKIDEMVAGNLQDVYPLTTRPKLGDNTSKVAAIDSSLKGHPMEGVGSLVRDTFKQALADKRFAGVSPDQVLEATKQGVLNTKGTDGASLLDKANKYKFDKENGMFKFFNREDAGTVALPGYADYKKANEKKYNTTLPEAVALNVGMTAVGALVTGGWSVPAQVLGKLAVSALVAFPEMKVMDTVANTVAKVNENNGNQESVLGEMAAGIAGLVGAKYGAKQLLTRLTTGAVKAGLTTQGIRDVLKMTGTATDAIKLHEASIAEQAASKALAVATDEASSKMIWQKAAMVGDEERKFGVFSHAKQPGILDSETGITKNQIGLEPGSGGKAVLDSESFSPKGLFDTDYLKTLGANADTVKYANENPSALFTFIKSPEAQKAVFDEIGQGSDATEAILRNFNREEAIASLTKGLTKDELVAEATKNNELLSKAGDQIESPFTSFDRLMTGSDESKIAKGKYVSTVKTSPSTIKPVFEDDITAAIPTQEQLYTGLNEPKIAKGTSAVKPVNVDMGNGAVESAATTEVKPTATEIADAKAAKTEVVLKMADKNEVAKIAEARGVDPETIHAQYEIQLDQYNQIITGKATRASFEAPKDTVAIAATLAKQGGGAGAADRVLKSVATLAVPSVAIAALMSPDQAQAGGFDQAAKSVAGVVLDTVKSQFGDDTKALIKAIKDNHWWSEKVGLEQTTLPQMQEQLRTAPKLGYSIDATNKVVGKRTSVIDNVAKYLSPDAFARVYGTTTNSVSVHLASMQNAITNNTENGLQVAKNIIKTVPGIEAKHSAEIANFMKPVQQAYDAVAVPMRTAEIEMTKVEKSIKDINEAVKSKGLSEEDAAFQLKEQNDKMDGLKKLYADYSPNFEGASNDYNAAIEQMAKQYPSARISLAAEDSINFDKYPFMKNIPLSYEEQAAIGMFKKFHVDYKQRSLGANLEVIDGDYVRHSRDITEISDKFKAELESLGVRPDSKSIALTEYFGRSKYSKQMIPDISRNVLDYVPDAEKRINVANFWKPGQDGGWDSFSKNELIAGNKVWSDFFDRLKVAYNPQPDTLTNRLAQRYASLETLRLLTFIPSAAFKHLFKNEGTWATLGVTNSLKHIPSAVTTAFRNATNDSLYKLGYTDRMLPKGALDDFVNSTMKQRSMINPLADLERPDHVVSAVDNWLDKLNNVGGVGIKAVEAFDRTHTIQAALDMSVKKGMTAEQSMYAIYDTILKNNFLGGALNPAWMHNPKIRALALFQNTPFKILERRVVNGIKFGDDVKTAWGVIKNQNLDKTLQDLTDVKTFVHGAQDEFKQNMIYDALTSTKDVFGNSVSAQFMREWIIAGSVVAGGSAVGLDFFGHSFHVPFLKDKNSNMVVATSPIVDATWKTLHPTVNDEKEFFVSRFLGNWFKTTGGAQPLLLHKFRRLSNDDIPGIYKGSALQYLFAVPSK